MNRPITRSEVETAIKGLPHNKSPGPDGLTAEFFPSETIPYNPKRGNPSQIIL